MYKDLKGKVAVVTGATSGIGEAIANRFVKEGMMVAINYHHDKDKAESMVAAFAKKGGKAIAVRADVKEEKDIKKLLEKTVGAFGRLDVWINNAGIQKPFSSHEMPLEEWQSVIDTNLTGTFLGSKAALNHFLTKKKAGNIINISSVHDVIPRPLYVHYAASKGGIKLLTETMAKEYAPNGIRINAIGPGGVDTPINEDTKQDPEREEEDKKKIPMGRVGSTIEIANVAAWLASDEASYVTGTTIYADGGMLLYPINEFN